MKISSCLLAFAGLLSAAGFASAQPNLVLFISQPGDYIGQGQTYLTTNQADIGLSGTPATITVTAFGYYFYFSGPNGANLTVGDYPNSARWPFNGSQPGLSVFGNGRGCNTECGAFQVMELHTDGFGNVDRLWITFSNRCECGFPPMGGDIRYRSQLAPAVPAARTLHVPADYATIQDGLDSASPFGVDTVLVAPGTYFENLNFHGHVVTLASEAGPAATIIDGSNLGPVVTFNSSEGPNSVIRGFTLQHGSESFGAGIMALGSSPTIVSNVFQNNAQGGGGFGAGIGGNGASPIIEQNLFRNNTADNQYLSGVVSFVNGSSPLIANNVFVDNPCRAINLTLPAGNSPIVINNTIVNNLVGIRVGAGVNTSGQSYLNNILAGNDVGLQVENGSPGNNPNWAYNLVTGGENYLGIPDQTGHRGNISADPIFVCAPNDDFRLLAGSPCIDAGTNGAPRLPPADFNGNTRLLDGDTNGSAIVDMGALEFDPASPPTACTYVICPTNIVVVAVPGQTSAVASYPAPTASHGATVTCLPPSGSVFPGGTSTVTCTAVNGTNTASCTFTVTVLVPPANDNFDLATVISSLPFTNILDTSLATASPDDPYCNGSGASVWYKLAPTQDLEILMDNYGSDYFVSLSAYTGSRSNLSQITCGYGSARFNASAGQTYYLMANAVFGYRAGVLQFHVYGLPPFKLGLSVDPNGSFDSKTGRATIHGTVTSTRATIVDVHGTLRQKLGRTRIIQGTFGLSVPCTNSAPWTATVESATGAFGGGAAEVSLDANAVDPITLESTNATMDVVAKLNGSKR